MSLSDFTHLTQLIEKGNKQEIEHFLEKLKLNEISYMSIEIGGKDLEHPVSTAARCGKVNIVNMLVSRGFDPDGQDYCYGADYSFWKPIQHAVKHRQMGVVRALVSQHRVTVDHEDGECAPIMLAIDNGDLQMVKYLVESGAWVNFTTFGERESCLFRSAKGNPEIVEYLISEGAGIDQRCGRYSLSPFMYAVLNRNVGAAQVLLDSGSQDVNMACTLFTSPFHYPLSYASKSDSGASLDMMRMLYSRGADPEIPDYGQTPLHIAVSRGLTDIVRFLVVEVGVSLDVRTPQGGTVLDESLLSKDRDIIDILLKSGYEPRNDLCLIMDENKDVDEEAESTQRKLIAYVKQIACNPRSLHDICCFRIRKLLKEDIQTRINSLPIPTLYKDFLKLKHV